MQRDKVNNQLLGENGWFVIRFWEQELKKDFEGCVNRVVNYIKDYPGQ